ATIFFIIVGIILPMTKTTGIYTLLVPAVYLATLIPMALAGLPRTAASNVILSLAIVLGMFHFLGQPLSHASTRYFLLTIAGGGITGLFIAT
ncbi:hypothetical protein, partial [Schaalia canis]|uniref:hypothetical protein n=1 Tax=Schaalia canis TaxID=100469 RepID=UPI0014041CAE